MLQIKKISEGFYKAVNVVSEHDAYIDRDMLGDFRATVEIKTEAGFDAAESEGFANIAGAARWIECRVGDKEVGGSPIIMSTNFDGSPMIIS